MSVDVSPQMVEKLKAVGDKPILDSEFIPLRDGSGSAEKVQGTKGWYISSPADEWRLHGPFRHGAAAPDPKPAPAAPRYVLPGEPMPDGTATPLWYPGLSQMPSKARVVIHGTRSGRVGNPTETLGTLRYCADPNSGASYSWLIDYDGTIYEMCGWGRGAWHAGLNNSTHYGVALAQPTVEDAITDAQHGSLRWLMRELHALAGVPLVRVFSQTRDGFVEHRDTEQGKGFGKTDVGPKLDWRRLL